MRVDAPGKRSRGGSAERRGEGQAFGPGSEARWRNCSALGENDYAYPLSQTDCLPLPDGRDAILLAVQGAFAKIRLCSEEAGCIDVYGDANSVIDAN